MLLKKYVLILVICLCTGLLFADTIKITRDKTLLKDGPGNFYDTVSVLNMGDTAEVVGESAEDPGWLEVVCSNKKGFISKMTLKEVNSQASDDPFAELDFSDIDKSTKEQIAPASYTAAIKGFAVDYSKRKGLKPMNLDELWEITEFKKVDFIKVKNETKLAYIPRRGELIGLEDAHINQRMTAIGLSASLDVLQNGVVLDAKMTKRLNVIANILNRQTIDYDIQYRVWILRDDEPVAYSGPGGYIFISDSMLRLLTDYRELVAIIAHEIGHVALRHGIRDVAIAQARYSAESAFDELETHMDADTLKISDELEKVVEQAVNACRLVRDDKEEFEADEISIALLKRYKINKKYLISALKKVKLAVGKTYPQYNQQIIKRLKKL